MTPRPPPRRRAHAALARALAPASAPPAPLLALLLLWALLLPGAHGAPTEDITTAVAPEGWSLERMLEEYGASAAWGGSSSASWSVLVAPWGNFSSSPSGDSWLGGVSQYFGAGGAAPIDTSAGVLTARFNALVPGFSAGGGGFSFGVGAGAGAGGARSLRANASMDDATALRARHALLNRVETALWAASILRDNMVTVFGYVLNLPGDHLDSELYTSLYHIYEQVRFRRFQVVPLVKSLKDMCRESPTRQFKNLFRAMEGVARPHMKSAVQFWVQALENKKIDLDGVLRPNGGPLIVDFLEGIDPSVVRQLADDPEFPPETEQKADAETTLLMGSVVANTFAAITDGTLPLTQTLFALLLQMRPAETTVPQRIEAERYISDSLRLQRVVSWRTIVKRAENARARGSVQYVRAILWALAESSDVDVSLQDAARLVHAYVKPSVPTYSNPNYKYTSAIMSRPTLDILYILKSITPSEYPEDVVDAKNRLKFYIEHGYLDMEFVVKGFNRFDHVKPINLVIAVLTRIETRLPMLSHEIKSSVKYLKVYLIFKKFLCSMSPQIPQDFLEAPFLLDSFEGPTMPKNIHELVVKLEAHLRRERLPVEKLIDVIPVEECSRPRQCILNVYRRVIKSGYITGPAKNLMISLITSLDINGDPLTPPHPPEYQIKVERRKKCRNKLWAQLASGPPQTTPKRATTTKPVTTPKLEISSSSFKPTTTTSTTTSKPTTMLRTTTAVTTTSVITTSKATASKDSVSFSDTTSPTTSPYPTTTSIVTSSFASVRPVQEEIDDEEVIYPGAEEPLVRFPILNETELHTKPNYSVPEELLPPTEVGTTEDTILRPIREFIRIPNLYSWLGYSFRPEAYSSKLHLLIAILKRAIVSSMVRFNAILFSSIKQYLTYLHTLPRRPQAIQHIVFPNVTEEFELQAANYEEPYKNLPTCTSESLECEKLHPIRVFLADENLYYKLGPYFKPSLYNTKGSFLKGLLQHALRLKYVHQNILLYRVTKQFLLHLNELHIQPVEVKSTPFPRPDLVKECEPPNWKRPLTLLPTTVPGTAEHIKMRPVREFFARADFWEIMGADFQPQNYRTKGELLVAIITHSLTLQQVKEDSILFACLKQYLSFLKQSKLTTESGAPDLSINMQTLVKALPYPETTEEEQHLRHIQELFKNQQFNAVMLPIVKQANIRTRGAALQLLLQKALEMQKQYQPKAPTLLALKYFKDRVIQEGYGAQAVDYLVPQKMEVLVLDLFRAIDHDRLSEEDRQRVKRVINFISNNFNPKKYLNGFKFEQYATKGEFLKAAFEHLCNLKFVRSQLKDDMEYLSNYILDEGPGAEPVLVQTENNASDKQ